MEINSLLKRYLGIQFLDSTNDIVPRLWVKKVKKNGLKISYPPNNIQELAKKEAPPKESWQDFTVTLLCQASK